MILYDLLLLIGLIVVFAATVVVGDYFENRKKRRPSID